MERPAESPERSSRVPTNRGQYWETIWREVEQAEVRRPRIRILANEILGDAVSRFSREFFLRHGVAGRTACRVLDVGSGDGRTSLELARRGLDVTLLDISEAAIRLSTAQFVRAGIRGTFRVGEATALPFPPDSFDAVLSTAVIDAFPPEQRSAALSEMVRVCKPGGRIAALIEWRGVWAYQWGKAFAERRGEWMPESEEPLESLAAFWPKGKVSVLMERRCGLLLQLYFLKYALPARPKTLRYAWRIIWELSNRLLWPLNNLPGYFLGSVAVKREEPPSPLPNVHSAVEITLRG